MVRLWFASRRRTPAVFVCRIRRRAAMLSSRTIRRPILSAYAQRSALKCASSPPVRPPGRPPPCPSVAPRSSLGLPPFGPRLPLVRTSVAPRSDLGCPSFGPRLPLVRTSVAPRSPLAVFPVSSSGTRTGPMTPKVDQQVPTWHGSWLAPAVAVLRQSPGVTTAITQLIAGRRRIRPSPASCRESRAGPRKRQPARLGSAPTGAGNFLPARSASVNVRV